MIHLFHKYWDLCKAVVVDIITVSGDWYKHTETFEKVKCKKIRISIHLKNVPHHLAKKALITLHFLFGCPLKVYHNHICGIACVNSLPKVIIIIPSQNRMLIIINAVYRLVAVTRWLKMWSLFFLGYWHIFNWLIYDPWCKRKYPWWHSKTWSAYYCLMTQTWIMFNAHICTKL